MSQGLLLSTYVSYILLTDVSIPKIELTKCMRVKTKVEKNNTHNLLSELKLEFGRHSAVVALRIYKIMKRKYDTDPDNLFPNYGITKIVKLIVMT